MKNIRLMLALCLILGMAAYFSSCEKKYDNNEVIYKGTVINTVTQKPFANTEVKVTDGEHINASVKTDENGQFSILVKFNEINGNYYLLIGDASCAQVRREFKGFGQSEINLGEIEVEGPKAATITTKPVSNITTESAMSGGNITDDGRAEITARGVCWSKAEYPTVSDSHTTNGTGKGDFESEIRGLESGVTYYVRAYATNSISTVYGAQVKFSTETGFPTVTTDVVSNVTATSAVCGGAVTNDSGYQITACGVCWSTQTSYPTISGSHTTDVIVSGRFNSVLENLERNTTYYVRAYATNQYGTSYGETITFSTILGIPVVKTGDVSNILASSAVCTGEIITNSGYNISVCGFCWSNTNPYPSTSDSFTSETATSGVFSSKMMNLENSTIYYVRAYATNDKGTGYGETQTFTTISGLPIVITGTVSNVLATSAVCSGTVSLSSEFAITARGVCWSSTTATPTIENEHTSEVPTTGNFTSTLSNLEVSTKYYVRAYATNSKGTSYGETVSFTTISGLPVVTTEFVDDILATSAVCHANVSLYSEFAITARGVCWSSKTSVPTIDDEHTNEVPDKGEFSSVLIGLSVNTTYYVRAYASNKYGIQYGNCVIFTSSDGLPKVETNPVYGEKLLNSTVVSGGHIIDDSGFPITCRGVVWSKYQYPTIESCSKTQDGNGIGYYSSEIRVPSPSTDSYYIRAYAVNANGVAYGEQVIVTPDDWRYSGLKTISYGGFTYKIYPLRTMGWQEGVNTCEDLLFAGYSDWFMPDQLMVQQILECYGVWSSWASADYSSNCYDSLTIENSGAVWSSTQSGSAGHIYYHIYTTYQGWTRPSRCVRRVCERGMDWTLYWTSSVSENDIKCFVFAVRKHKTN